MSGEPLPAEAGSSGKTCVFVATTPLQILFAFAIARDLSPETACHVVIVGRFTDAEAVCLRLGSGATRFGWRSAAYFRSFPAAAGHIASLKADQLFIDADVGIRKHLHLLFQKALSPGTRINVYEEGLGTYRTDLYAGMRRRIVAATGAGTHFGGSVLTRHVYVLRPQLYISTFPATKEKVRAIAHSPMEVILQDREEFYRLFDYSPLQSAEVKTRNSILYLSSWQMNEAFVETAAMRSEDVFIKPHPHFRGELGKGAFRIVPGGAPAELVLVNLLDLYDRIEVFHHGSSVTWYLSDDRVTYTRI